MNTKAMNMDEMLKRTLWNYLSHQAEMYRETMGGIGENEHIALVQAKYEVSCIAVATTLKWVLGLRGDTDLLPDAWQEPWGRLHNLICEVGDDYLRSKGINPEEL